MSSTWHPSTTYWPTAGSGQFLSNPPFAPVTALSITHLNDIKAVSDYQATTISVHITRAEQHPVFGEGVLLTLDDEGGGAFLVIEDTSDASGGKVRLELGELEQLVIEARKLVQAVEP